MPMKNDLKMFGEFEEAYTEMIKEEAALPEEWRGRYEVTACLKDSVNKKTYLLKEKSGEKRYILKLAFREETAHLLEEGKILKELQKTEDQRIFAEEAVSAVEVIDKGQKAYLLRDYIEGSSLAEIGEKQSFSDKEILQIGILLCRSVQNLHQRKPPVIHRDIKPENIILRKEKSIALIDLEMARFYKKGKSEDTYFAGTRETAAPEQYGFGQSDERTDIYGIGRTLLYMKTGDYLLEDMKRVSGNRRLNSIIKKCCEFDPDNRFPSVKALLYELQRGLSYEDSDKKRMRMLTILVGILGMAVLILLLQVILLKRNADNEQDAPSRKSAANWQEELGGAENYQDRILILGWDVTDYDLLVAQILDSCEQREYDLLAKQCGQLFTELYQDEFLQAVEAEDTYYYEENDARWEAYHITRTGYEKAADDLAYHDRMLESEIDNLEQYRYYIFSTIRGIVEATETDGEGNIVHTLLYQYQNSKVENKEEVDYCIDEILNAIICGIELYHSENIQ